ncbi:MAG: hypothetical protein M0Q41_06450 [Bacteroidales bacterium]|nr:hypothetical protein [Bacteroidales bacterium]MDD3700983.1 hypothetical protein [Bacteroidales bacterium]
MLKQPKTYCLECGDELFGRSDKKFCNDQCRSAHYRRQHGSAIRLINNINNQLKKNRAILLRLNPDGIITIKKSTLDKAGFNFNFFTSTYTTREGRTYRYVYDQGYLLLDKDMVMLVINKDYKTD